MKGAGNLSDFELHSLYKSKFYPGPRLGWRNFAKRRKPLPCLQALEQLLHRLNANLFAARQMLDSRDILHYLPVDTSETQRYTSARRGNSAVGQHLDELKRALESEFGNPESTWWHVKEAVTNSQSSVSLWLTPTLKAVNVAVRSAGSGFPVRRPQALGTLKACLEEIKDENEVEMKAAMNNAKKVFGDRNEVVKSLCHESKENRLSGRQQSVYRMERPAF